MYTGIIQTAISTRLPLDLDYRRPAESRTRVLFLESASRQHGMLRSHGFP
jgi:hypothetical protein